MKTPTNKVGQLIVKNKARSSVQFCTEKNSCSREKEPACFYCQGCRSYQCQACHNKIHLENLKFAHHDRRELPSIDTDRLCQSESCLKLDFANLADYYCESCQLRLCCQCDTLHHRVEFRKNHRRIELDIYLLRKQEEAEEKERQEVLSSDYISLDTPPASLYPQNFDIVGVNSKGDTFVSAITEQPTGNVLHSDQSTVKLNQPESTVPSPGKKFSDKTTIPDSQQQMNNKPSFNSKPLSSSDFASLTGATKTKTSRSNNYTVDNLCHVVDDDSLLISGNGYPSSSSQPGSINGFCLIDQDENCQVKDAAEFVSKLNCDMNTEVKVISIFGNTGDGKSYTLNHTFFDGREVFSTSSKPNSCTAGVWAAFEPMNKFLVIDTEGLLGSSANSNQRRRLLLKVLACSDIVIYRTKAERLHDDLFYFMADASDAYVDYFKKELSQLSEKLNLGSLSRLGPDIIVFHETTHTETLAVNSKEAVKRLKDRFGSLNLKIEAFTELHYIGTRTGVGGSTDFGPLLALVKKLADNNSVRSWRDCGVVLYSLTALNQKFSGEISFSSHIPFPERYFSCRCQCLACEAKCKFSINHESDGVEHDANRAHCKYMKSMDNQVLLCKVCYERGRVEIVVPKTAEKSDNSVTGAVKFLWSGFVLECTVCGVIYRSRQYWTGNPDIDVAVVKEFRHVWPNQPPLSHGYHNAGQRVLDGVTYLTGTVSEFSSGPTKMMLDWLNDNVAPDYWQPNASITNCAVCNRVFEAAETKHHCRNCGLGVCDECSPHRRRVPHRGWGDTPVRICKSCFSKREDDPMNSSFEEVPNSARLVTEKVAGAVELLSNAVKYSSEMVKSCARPDYWVPDSALVDCSVCGVSFSVRVSKHHCRCCGNGVCSACSPHFKPVPLRGWDQPVRVCTRCVESGLLDRFTNPSPSNNGSTNITSHSKALPTITDKSSTTRPVVEEKRKNSSGRSKKGKS